MLGEQNSTNLIVKTRSYTMNSVSVQVCGKRKHEVCLIVPGCYRARAKRRKFADIFSKELKVMKSKYAYFDFELEQDTISKPLIQRGR